VSPEYTSVDWAWNVCNNLLTMWVTSLSIENFRCFGELSLAFREGLNILVGENNVGKSTMFVALSKLLQSTQQNPSDIFTGLDLRYGELKGGFGPSLECTLSLNQREQQQLVEHLFQQKLSSADRADAYRLLAPSTEAPKVVFEWREALTHTYIKLGPMFILNNWVSNQVRHGGSSSKLSELLRQLKEHGNKRMLEEELERSELWDSAGVLHRVGRLLSSHFKTFAEFRARPSSSGRSAALESLQGGETANVLLNLKNNHEPQQRRRYATICSEFSNFFPPLSIEAVEKEPGGKTADIQFTEAGRDYPISLDNVGAGVAELLTLLANLVAREGYVFIIEEPELHLHPQAKRRLQALIKNSAKSNQVFVITHDTIFVDPDNLSALTRFSITYWGTHATFMPDSLPEKVRFQLKTAMKDPTKREVVFARVVLLVEDESQQKFILGCANVLPYDLDSNGISVISVDGADGFEPYIKLMEALEIPYLCLRDQAWKSSAKKPARVFRFLGYELEEFLEQADLGSLIKQAKREVGTSKPRVAGYVGEHLTTDHVPPLFCELIRDAVKLSEELQATGKKKQNLK